MLFMVCHSKVKRHQDRMFKDVEGGPHKEDANGNAPESLCRQSAFEINANRRCSPECLIQ